MRRSVLLGVAWALLMAAPAAAAPVALSPDEAPGLKRTKAGKSAVRALLPGSRGRPAAASAFRYPGRGRLLTGSVELRSSAAARRVQRRARSRTKVRRKRSVAVRVVRAGRHVGVVSLSVRKRDRSVGRVAAAYAAALRVKLLHEDRQTVADRLAEEGTSKADALALFRIAYGSMPGARIPKGRRGVVRDGTQAIGRLLRILPQLSPAQRAAFARATEGGSNARKSALTPDAEHQKIAEDLIPLYEAAGRVGKPLGFPVKVFKSTTPSGDSYADAYPVDAAGKLKEVGPAYCRIRLFPSHYKTPASFRRFVIAHELFHCFEFSITTNWGGTERDWVIEGMADWAASQVVSDNTLAEVPFASYLMKPLQPLFQRAYTAVGFWGHVHERVPSLWPRVVPVLTASGQEAAYDAAGGSNDAASLTAASRYLRDGGPGFAWDTKQPFLIPDASAPTPRTPSATTTAALTAKAHVNRLFDLLPVSGRPVVALTRESGTARYTDRSTDFPDAGTTWFCTGGKCECKADEESSLPSPLHTVDKLVVAVAGEKTGGTVRVKRHKLSEFCKKDKKPKPKGPGGSNGDPHLTSLDGLRYDFQAAGEFVLVRSRSRDLEIQARQEPWEDSTRVTINTQIASRIGGRRVTVEAGDDLVLRVDGRVQSVPPGGTLPVGAGRIQAGSDEVTLTWPDGSAAQVFSVGRWGVAVSVQLADGRANRVAGLLGDFDGQPRNDLATRGGKRLKFALAEEEWPGLDRVEPKDPDNRKFFDALYDRVGDSWRISQRESLFDYPRGKNTKSYTKKSIPKRPVEAEDFSRSRRRRAEEICRAAGVTAPGALEDCILDVIITGQAEFAEAAAKEEALTSVRWRRLAAGADRYGPVSLARTGDGTLHLVWEDRVGTDERVVHGAIAAGGAERAPVLVTPLDTTPYAFAAPEGLRVVGAAIDLSSGVTGIFQFGAPPPYAAWSPRARVTEKGYSYVGEPMSLVAGGTLYTVTGEAGYGRVYRGEGASNAGHALNPAFLPDCYATQPAIAASGGAIVAAWRQWDCAQPGLYVAAIDPATGAPGAAVPVPGSSWTALGGRQAFDPVGLDRLSMAARAGGGIHLAYARRDGDRWSVLLWRVGAAQPLVVASDLASEPQSVQVSAEPTSGRLWVAWEAADVEFGRGRLAVRRTNPAATGWDGAPRVIAFPSDADPRSFPVHPWDVLARDGGLDVVAGYPRGGEFGGALWHAVVPG